MNPWTLLGWILFLFSLIMLAPIVGDLFTDLKIARVRRRANAGKAKCQFPGCDRTSAWGITGGYCCDRHLRQYQRIYGNWMPKRRLDHAAKQDSRRDEK